MGKTSREMRKQKAGKKLDRQTVITTLAILGGILIILLAKVAVNAKATESYTLPPATLSEDGSLHIQKSALKPGMFNYLDWGGSQELIVLPEEDGTYGVALDTCESCHVEYEGNVHFTRSNEKMICRACGSVLELSQFGQQDWGGCQPLAIPDAGRQDTDTEIVLTPDVMAYAVRMLQEWDAGDVTTTTFAMFGQDDAADTTDDAAADDTTDAEATAEPTAEPTAESTTEPTAEPTVEPTAESTDLPAATDTPANE